MQRQFTHSAIETAGAQHQNSKSEQLVHHVFFWLKDDLQSEDIKRFEDGVSSLPPIEHVHFGEVGKPAKTKRPIIERSYAYSLLLVFENEAEHDNYQVHPTHKYNQTLNHCNSHQSTKMCMNE